MRRRLEKGFTLIELMVVVGIVAIIAAIALPSYMEQAAKSRRSDAVRALGQLQMDLERWRAECPTYADVLACKDFDNNGTLDPNTEGKYPGTPTSDYYTIAPSGQSATGYSITATPKGAQLNDRCGTYTFAMASGVLTKTASGGSNCSL
jgi:type IV pilus assembly protein PilE